MKKKPCIIKCHAHASECACSTRFADRTALHVCVRLTWLFHTTAISGVQLSSSACSITVVSTCACMYMCMDAWIYVLCLRLDMDLRMYQSTYCFNISFEDVHMRVHITGIYDTFTPKQKCRNAHTHAGTLPHLAHNRCVVRFDSVLDVARRKACNQLTESWLIFDLSQLYQSPNHLHKFQPKPVLVYFRVRIKY